jgi:hypothetical protein
MQASSVVVTASVGVGGNIIVLVLFIVLVAIELLVPIATYMAALATRVNVLLGLAKALSRSVRACRSSLCGHKSSASSLLEGLPPLGGQVAQKRKRVLCPNRRAATQDLPLAAPAA